MNQRVRMKAQAMKNRAIWIAVGLLLVAGVVARSIRRVGRGVPKAYTYDVEQYRDIEKGLPRPYAQAARWPLALLEARALAVTEDGQTVVAGDQVVLVLNGAGEEKQRIELDNKPLCVETDGDRIYVGFLNHIEVYGRDGAKQTAWETLGEQAYLVGLAVLDGEVFATDYGQRVVWRFDASGRMLGRISRPSPKDGFVFPSPTFDVAAGGDSVWVINSGRRRVEQYSPAGKQGAVWGRSSMEIDGFSGCCNPTRIALMPDGRFVTTEKGLPRVKVYTAQGQFEALVAGSTQLGPDAGALDVAVDGAGRIVVLDAADRSLRIYEEKQSQGTGVRGQESG
jgi:hypothetical protein